MKQKTKYLLVSSVISLLIIILANTTVEYIKKRYISDPISGWRSLSFSGYPQLREVYKVTYPKKEFPDETVKLKQEGTFIKGEIVAKEGNYEFVGNVSPTGHIVYNFKSRNPNVNDFGVGFLKLSPDGKSASGYVLFMSGKADEPNPVRVIVKEIL